MTHSDISPHDVPDTGPTDWEALARHLTGESSPEESARVDAWLVAHPDQREILATLDNAMNRMADELPADLDIEGALTRVKARRDARAAPGLRLESAPAPQKSAPPAPRWRVPVPALAASGLLAIGALSWAALRDRTPAPAAVAESRMLATGVGVRDSLTLPDGSRVILGPLSSVKVASGYGASAREVEVSGDAWFDVAHDERKPFTVRAGNATIVDIGTRFTVRSDAGAGIAVSVTEGSVSLRDVNVSAADGVILKAGDNGVLGKDGHIVTSRGTAGEDDVAWMSGKLVFREAPVSEVIASVHRWYGLDLRISDSSLVNRHITATFNGESPERMLEVLRLVLGAEMERNGDTVVVRAAGGSVRSR